MTTERGGPDPSPPTPPSGPGDSGSPPGFETADGEATAHYPNPDSAATPPDGEAANPNAFADGEATMLTFEGVEAAEETWSAAPGSSSAADTMVGSPAMAAEPAHARGTVTGQEAAGPATAVLVAGSGSEADSEAEQLSRRERRRRKKEEKGNSFWKELPVLLALGLLVVVLLRAFVVQAFYIPSGSMEDSLQINDRVLVFRQAYLFGEPQRGDVIVFRNWDDVGEDVPSPSVGQYIWQSLKEGVGLGRGDGQQDLIKRVIAVPGDTVEVKDSRVFINGEELIEPYILVDGPDALADFGPVVVPKGKYFVLGDHRNNSNDSRRVEDGLFVDEDAIVGKAFIRIWPFSRIGGLDAPEPLQQDR